MWRTKWQAISVRPYPEETRLVGKALERGYAVVAVSSVGRCWSAPADGPRVKAALSDITSKNADLAGKPIFAFGASSGGAFVGALPFITAVDGVIAQISSIRLPTHLADKVGRCRLKPAETRVETELVS
jgi:hypothetical protein